MFIVITFLFIYLFFVGFSFLQMVIVASRFGFNRTPRIYANFSLFVETFFITFRHPVLWCTHTIPYWAWDFHLFCLVLFCSHRSVISFKLIQNGNAEEEVNGIERKKNERNGKSDCYATKKIGMPIQKLNK